ncbi:MAG TPA: NAD-dependent epimerase/dehydratase family protein [bacterium]|nr:NAD-dependent epimerase/dehydratase family protein [bacterium]
MKILVIGGSGFLSSVVVAILLERGHQVTTFTRGRSGERPATTANLIRLTGDRHDPAALQNALLAGPFDAVYDFVAYEPAESRLAAKTFHGRVGRFIHCSTISVYLVSDQVICPITEEQDKAPLMPFWERNPFGMTYGINKRACEEILWQAHDERQFPVSMLRPTFISGPHDPAKRDFFWIERINDGGPLLVPGHGEFLFQSVYVEDAARAFTDLLEAENSIGKAYNVAAEEILSLNDYLHLLARLMGRDIRFVHLDQELFDRLPFSRHPGGDVFPFNTRRDATFSLEEISRDLGYHTTPIAQWLATTIDWFTTHYNGHSTGYEARAQELAVIQKIDEDRSPL